MLGVARVRRLTHHHANDNWKDTQQAEIEASGFQPQNDMESAIISTLDPGSYTAVVSGKDGGTGVGLVEGYDLIKRPIRSLATSSYARFVETGTNVMIGASFWVVKAEMPMSWFGPWDLLSPHSE